MEKSIELLNDVISKEKCSDCCGASVYSPTNEWAQCIDCKEMCDIALSE